MYKIDSEKFNQALLQFIGCVLAKQDDDHYQHSTKISFKSGFLKEAEGYKQDVWNQAQEILQSYAWSKDSLWKYHISRRVLSCMNIQTTTGEKQNLLNWHDVEYFKDIVSEHSKTAESVLYQIYCTDNDERSFSDAISLFGNRYPLISFLFFLKKSKKKSIKDTPFYLPIRPQIMDEQFQKLGIQSNCLSDGCTWEHYQECIRILQDVKNRLNRQLDSTASLLDAHSFVWSMWLLAEISEKKNPIADLPQQFYTLEKDVDSLQGYTRDAVVKVRVNQSVFRNLLLEKQPCKCCLCGIMSPHLLVASHIKPWAVSDPAEKLDIDNGFLFCPNHDRLFDQGFISFDDTGKIMVSDHLSQNDITFTNIQNYMKIHLTDGNKLYLAYHREHIFKR